MILLAEPDAALRESWRSGFAAVGFHDTADVINKLSLQTETEQSLDRAARRGPVLNALKTLVVTERASEADREWALAVGVDM